MKIKILILSLILVFAGCKKDMPETVPEDISWKQLPLEGNLNIQLATCMRDSGTLMVATPDHAVYIDVSKGMKEAKYIGGSGDAHSYNLYQNFYFQPHMTAYIEGNLLVLYEYQFYERKFSGLTFDTAFTEFIPSGSGIALIRPLNIIDNCLFVRYQTKQNKTRGLLLRFTLHGLLMTSFKTFDLPAPQTGSVIEFNKRFIFTNADSVNTTFSMDTAGNISPVCGMMYSCFERNDTLYSFSSKSIALTKDGNCLYLHPSMNQLWPYRFVNTSAGVFAYRNNTLYKFELDFTSGYWSLTKLNSQGLEYTKIKSIILVNKDEIYVATTTGGFYNSIANLYK